MTKEEVLEKLKNCNGNNKDFKCFQELEGSNLQAFLGIFFDLNIVLLDEIDKCSMNEVKTFIKGLITSAQSLLTFKTLIDINEEETIKGVA